MIYTKKTTRLGGFCFVKLLQSNYNFVGENRVRPHGEPPSPIRVDSF